MLYSIIPPILVVLSLVGIIIFLMKKAPVVANLEEESQKEEKSEILRRGFLGKFRQSEKRAEKKETNYKLLLILEKITRKFKIVFLKLENLFTNWSESIKLKRKIKEYKENQKISNAKKKKNISQIKEKNNEVFERRQKKENPLEKNENMLLQEERKQKSLEKNIQKSKKIVEKKDLFEKILIERIAANPKDIEAYERLGEYYLEIENWNYAKECFKQVLKLSPENENIKGKMKRLEKMLDK